MEEGKGENNQERRKGVKKKDGEGRRNVKMETEWE